jgi:transcriptional regulator with XRE-family HTH domain
MAEAAIGKVLSWLAILFVDIMGELVRSLGRAQACRRGSSLDDFEGIVNQVAEERARETAAAKAQPIAKLNYSHEGMVNLILANRGITQNELAAHFGYSASWISQVMSSDAFQAKLAERAAEIEDPTLRATVKDQLQGLAARSLEILREKLNAEMANIPDNLALRTLELSTRALGYGAKEPQVAVQVNVDNHLEQLGSRLERLLERKQIESQASPRATEVSLPTNGASSASS